MCQHMHSPLQIHFTAIRIFRYTKGTLNKDLRKLAHQLFSDAEWARDAIDRRSSGDNGVLEL